MIGSNLKQVVSCERNFIVQNFCNPLPTDKAEFPRFLLFLFEKRQNFGGSDCFFLLEKRRRFRFFYLKHAGISEFLIFFYLRNAGISAVSIVFIWEMPEFWRFWLFFLLEKRQNSGNSDFFIWNTPEFQHFWFFYLRNARISAVSIVFYLRNAEILAFFK